MRVRDALPSDLDSSLNSAQASDCREFFCRIDFDWFKKNNKTINATRIKQQEPD